MRRRIPRVISTAARIPGCRAERGIPLQDPRTLMLELMLALPFVLALALAILRDAPAKAVAWLAGLAPLLALAVLGWLTPAVMAGEIPRGMHEWPPHAGPAFSRARKSDGN